MNTGSCQVCGSRNQLLVLDLGNQVLCNRYLVSKFDAEAEFPIKLVQCDRCGLVQLTEPVPADELRPRFDWITYNEQEGHLDDLVERICNLPGLTRDSRIGAMSFKDDSTVERFRMKGFTHAWRLDPTLDLGIVESFAGLETIQKYLTPERARDIAAKLGKADVIIVRHILEHAHQPQLFASALRELVQPNGYLVFEVPDCEPALLRYDYTMPWEEHIVYFTPDTFQRSLAILGFSLLHYHCYLYSNENSLIAIGSPSQAVQGAGPINPAARLYGEAFLKHQTQVVKTLKRYRRSMGKVAIFGAGHLSCAWVNFLRVAEQIEFFVDDHPRKRELSMPGSRLPIRGSASLLEENIKLCLLSLSPESEKKVVAKNQPFVDAGGVFASIFPGKANSIAIDVD